MRQRIIRQLIAILLHVVLPILVLVGMLAVLPETFDDTENAVILAYIAVVFTVAVIVMLVYTRSWSRIGSGLVATMLGDALLYGRTSAILVGVPGLHAAWTLDVIRASFIVGATLLLIGLAQWVRAQQAGRDNAMLVKNEIP